ncbi:hypothetical protein BXO88_01270 [Oribacterium sp. C9]|uniref:hypothetical protein n=1 Tax=Oribacterium sp. C9 TaxID=1943579 RepID=UPI00098F75A1|nr:hypothetical protein [Oribacterium sp. C9]OON88450.1 hypothetical protein BXO88_01270 [Oribacterium sp. C9]
MAGKIFDWYLNFDRKRIYTPLYYLAMIIYFPLMLISISYFQPQLGEQGIKVVHYTRILAYLIFLLIVGDGVAKSSLKEMCKKKFPPMSQIILVGMLAVSIISAYFSRKSEAFVIMLIIAATVEVKPDTKKLFMLIAGIQFCSIIFFWYLSMEGILPNEIRDLDRGILGRHSFGFAYVTFPPMLMLFITMEYIYARGVETVTLTEMGILGVINYILFRYCVSRNSVIIAGVYLMSVFLYKYLSVIIDKLMALGMKIYGMLIAVLLAVSFLGPGLYVKYWKGDVSEELGTLTARLWLSYSAMQRYNVFTLFGQKIEWEAPLLGENKGDYIFVDNAYLHLLLDFGVVFFVVVILIYLFIIDTFKVKNEYINCIMMILILVLAVVDPRLWVLVFNPFPLLLSIGYEDMIIKMTLRRKKK